MVKSYFLREINTELEKQGIISNNRPQLTYRPREPGAGYRRVRRLATGRLGGGIEILSTVASLFSSVAEKVLAPVDDWLYQDTSKVGKRFFRDQAGTLPWYKAYEGANIRDRKSLDNYVHMAGASTSINEKHGDNASMVKLGIAIAATADYLSQHTAIDIPQLEPHDFARIITDQKVKDPETTAMIRRLSQKYSPREIGKMLMEFERDRPQEASPEILMLSEYYKKGEFALRIGSALGSSIGSQLSVGKLRAFKVGMNAGSYMGMFSRGLACPRYFVDDDVGPDFMTHARRGIGKVGGNAEQGVLEGATGGIAIVEGFTEHHFCHDMDSTTWPAGGISINGIKIRNDDHFVIKNEPEAQNGFIVSLNRSHEIKEGPYMIIFENGKSTKTHLKPETQSYVSYPEQAMGMVRESIQGWANTHRDLISQMQTGQSA